MKHSNTGSILDKIGNTPLIPLRRLPLVEGMICKVFIKCEFMNPSGSLHDRVAMGIIDKIKNSETFQQDGTLISDSNPDLSISMAMVAALRGHKNISILPLKTNASKKDALIALGSKISLIPKLSLEKQFSKNGFALAEKFVNQIPGCINIRQFLSDSQSSTEAIVAEILKTGLRPNMFVFPMDFEGSFSDVVKKLKQANDKCFVMGVEPGLSESEKRAIVNQPEIVQITNVSEKDALTMTRRLIKDEGILCGPSGGALVVAAFNSIKQLEINDDDTATVIICISESLNNSDKQFLSDEFMINQGFYFEKDMHQRYWWYGISIGNLRLNSPPTISKSKTIGAAGYILKNADSPRLVVLDMTADASEKTIVGVVTQELVHRWSHGEFMEEQCLGETEGAICRNFGEISRNATLGDLEQKLKLYEFAVVYNVMHKVLPNGTSRSYHFPIGVASVIDIIKWTSEVEQHHKQNLNSDFANNAFSDD